MNATEAIKLTQEFWGEHENEYLKHLVGFQTKVETAAKAGRITCTVAVLPCDPPLLDFVGYFFEQQGYYVGYAQTPTGEISCSLNWKLLPDTSRAYLEALALQRALTYEEKRTTQET